MPPPPPIAPQAVQQRAGEGSGEEEGNSDTQERLRSFFNRARLVRMRYAEACREDQRRQAQLRQNVDGLDRHVEIHNMQQFDRQARSPAPERKE